MVDDTMSVDVALRAVLLWCDLDSKGRVRTVAVSRARRSLWDASSCVHALVGCEVSRRSRS